MSPRGDLNNSSPGYLAGGLTMFLVKKFFFKYSMALMAQMLKKNLLSNVEKISNVDLGLFYPNNQLMFSFATFMVLLNC